MIIRIHVVSQELRLATQPRGMGMEAALLSEVVTVLVATGAAALGHIVCEGSQSALPSTWVPLAAARGLC